MYAIVGAILFSAIALMTILAALGLPVGEFTMGGQHKILPGKLRIAAIVSAVIQVFAMVILLQAGGFVPLFFSARVTRSICFFFAVYLSMNTVANIISKSKKERYVMTPLSLIAAVCYWVAALQG